MIVDENRLKEQLNAVELWKNNHHKGTFVWATGVGKTYAAKLAIQEYSESKLVIVPTVFLKKQWEDRLSDVSNLTVVVINTAIKNSYDVDILILDEIHRYAADDFSKIFDCVNYKKILGLTATLERSDKKHYMLEMMCPSIHKITVKEALEKGFISDVIVYNYGVKMSTVDMNHYELLDKRFNNAFGFFNFDFTVAMDCLTKPEARRLLSIRTGHDEKEIHVRAINFNRAMKNRKNAIYFNKQKILDTVRIVEKFKGKKIIIFTERLDVAHSIKTFIPKSFVYDSSKHSKKALDKFMEYFKEYNDYVLIAAKALDEGMDIPDIDVGIIHSNSSSKRQGIQRNGRIIRKSGDKIALIVNVYLEDTQDKKWLLNRISEIPNVYWANNINEITYDPSEELLKEEDRISDFTKRIRLF
jgi:superfamily II DNA or RNA helicase